MCATVNGPLLDRYAKLIVEVGTNVQPGQDILMIGGLTAAPLMRAVAAEAYAHGARFFDPWYFDPQVKRIRAQVADPDSLEFVPPWYEQRILQLGAGHGVRISVAPTIPPGLMDGVDPAVAGRDQLPKLPAHLSVINARTTNWCVVPWATVEWARVVHPGLGDDDALAKLWEQLVYVLRLDADDAAAAWRERVGELHSVGQRLDRAGLDALHFEGPGTDLTVGLFPTSQFAGDAPGSTTVDGVVFNPNLPTEEVFTTPDPTRTEGLVTATKPLDVDGMVVSGLKVRFEAGRVVQIDADENADILRARVAKDDGAARLGEVALVDREGRIGKTDTVFFNTLLDENAASHIALGNAYAAPVGEADRDKINESSIHIDFMIGSNDVAVTGKTRDGRDVPVLRDGSWQL